MILLLFEDRIFLTIFQIPSSTVTMILVSVIFLLLEIPNDSYTLKSSIAGYNVSTSQDFAINTLFFNTMVCLSYLNSSINFINYFVTGRKFRQAAVNTVMCRWRISSRRPKVKPIVGECTPASAIGMAKYSVTTSMTTTPSTSVLTLQE